jgi:hypothetical protein
MRDHHLLLPLAVTICLSAGLLLGDAAFADGKPGYDQARQQRPTTRQYDPRLPPVMPGEEIVTETGQKMKVWSSAGPVPVNPQPTPQQLPSGVNGAGIGVIVDSRDRFDHAGHAGQSRGSR